MAQQIDNAIQILDYVIQHSEQLQEQTKVNGHAAQVKPDVGDKKSQAKADIGDKKSQAPKQKQPKGQNTKPQNTKEEKPFERVTLDEGNELKGILAQIFQQAISQGFKDIEVSESVQLTRATNPQFGHYQCNNAMSLFSKIKGQANAPKNPRECGQRILENVQDKRIIESLSIAGPGFINIKVSKQFLEEQLIRLLQKGFKPPQIRYKKAVVDFSSPNVAKEMHVGHLRSTIIGDSICRALEFCGVDTLRINHIGDWGTQFGMLIQYLQELNIDESQRKESIADLMQFYKNAKVKFDADQEFKYRAREAVTRLQGGDKECLKMWENICNVSKEAYQQIYDRLDIKIVNRGESYYNDQLSNIVKELRDKGLAVESEGATCIFIPGFENPFIIQKSDGGYGYATTDLACIKQRLQEEKGEWLIYITDAGQSTHFEQLFKAAQMAKWYIEKDGPRIDHISFGVVCNEDGKKFKSREGATIKLADLLDKARDECKESIVSRKQEQGQNIQEQLTTIDRSAAIMGYGAVKYADLKNNRNSDYIFSYKQMLSLQGNTAVYLQYAHARICGIIRKSDKNVQELVQLDNLIQLEHPKEIELALHISRFNETLVEMLQELLPNRISEYLYQLSDIFNSFYTECKVIGSEQELSRLLLCESTALVMRQSLSILGIQPLDRI